MNETLFYVFGIGLVVSALAVSAIGLRMERFPATRAVLVAVVVYFAGMVAATTTFAVLNAADEQHQREAEEAQEEAANASEGETTTATTAAPATETTPAAEGGEILKLAADPSAIAYDTQQLSGKAGEVTIEFDNPSQITHDVCIDSPSGQEIGCSQTISDDSTSLSESLKPGKYTFFCSVDGHEAAGMKGTLTLD
jgi:plastocyanin